MSSFFHLRNQVQAEKESEIRMNAHHLEIKAIFTVEMIVLDNDLILIF